MGLLMPVLKPSTDVEKESLFFKYSLFDNEEAPIALIVEDEGEAILYKEAADEAEYNSKLSEYISKAFQNLKQVCPVIGIEDAEGSKIAFVSESEYASEKIMDVEFMKEISQKLGADSLMVGIPFKGLLVAIDSNSDLRLKFPAVVSKYYHSPDQHPITERVFLVQDGEIMAISGSGTDKPQEGFILTEVAGTGNYKVEMEEGMIDELGEIVNSSYQQIMQQVMSRKVFGGYIDYYIPTAIPLTDALIKKCNGYVDQVAKNAVAQIIVKSITGTEAKLRFYHGDQLLASAAESDSSSAEHRTHEKKWWQFWK